MKNIRAVVIALIVLIPSSVHAEAFSIERFDATIQVQENARFVVEETIDVDFTEPRHGIFRTIPVRYTDARGINRSIRLRVSGVTDEYGHDIPYTTRRSGRDVEIKIGDPDRLVIGPVAYTIRYTVDRGILFFDDHDELYWNVTGTEWPVEIEDSSASVFTPAPIGEVATECFTGPFGSTESMCTTVREEKSVRFLANDILTIVVGWPKGHVTAPTIFDNVVWFLTDNGIAALPVATFFILLYLWWTRGRDVRGRKTIIAQYEPPDRMTPGEMGTLVDARVHPQDFSAEIVHLAVKGYVRIVEEERGVLKRKHFSLKLVKPADAGLEEHERIVLNTLFGSKQEVHLRQGVAKSAFDAFAKHLYAHLAREHYFVRNPNVSRLAYGSVGLAIVAIAVFFLGPFLGVLGIISVSLSGILIILFARIMPKKTKKGTLAYEHALGFKEYLSVAEKHRVQWQEKERIFETFLPYAMVFGVAKQWANALQDTMREPPEWYAGSFAHGFNAAAFSSSLDSFSRSTNSASTPAQGAGGGSSGFGGGGFSGGGFGGGGGGSW